MFALLRRPLLKGLTVFIRKLKTVRKQFNQNIISNYFPRYLFRKENILKNIMINEILKCVLCSVMLI